MAHSNQARKRNRQNERTNERNRIVRSDLRTFIKKYRVAAAKGEGAEMLATVESKLDKAAKRNIIPSGRANRLKGRLKKFAAKK